MILVVGLGNPTDQYKNTRHNIGFMLIDLLKDDSFTDISSSKFQGSLFKSKDILLLKPNTFMNLSGNSVKAVNDFFKPTKIIVIHDDLDLPFGAIKFKKGGSSAGHNGLKSIDTLIGNNYERVRIGIGKIGNAANFVLSDFNESEKEKLKEILDYAKNATNELIRDDVSQISTKYSTKRIFS